MDTINSEVILVQVTLREAGFAVIWVELELRT